MKNNKNKKEGLVEYNIQRNGELVRLHIPNSNLSTDWAETIQIKKEGVKIIKSKKSKWYTENLKNHTEWGDFLEPVKFGYVLKDGKEQKYYNFNFKEVKREIFVGGDMDKHMIP